ncbi:MAG: hypothetical protein HYR96_08330 [Deltaproteobacteria bacterium]|nr:hypothetical protein [Deltaproteobacteria bacterium]MBI3294971.1 hypothetical protein [Deltaproteobacteria bacterium]
MKNLTLVLSAATFLMGCAHSMMRGTVVMKDTEDELHVCMGEKEVKAGDRVAFFTNKCTPRGGREALGDRCTKIRIGEGAVIQSLNEHYSMVRPDAGVGAKVTEGTVVEKI